MSVAHQDVASIIKALGASSLDPAESRRLHDVARYRMLHATDNPRIHQTARCLRVPIVCISLFVDGKIWRVGSVGLPTNLFLGGATLTSVALEKGGAHRVRDLSLDPQLRNHYLRLTPVLARSTAIVPFRSAESDWAGSVNIWSREVRDYTEAEMALLGEFAGIAAAELDDYRASYEAAVRQEFFRSILDNAPYGISVTRRDGTRVTANDRLASMLGYTVPELMQTNFLDVTFPGDADQGIAQHQSWARGEVASYLREARLVRRSGEVFWARITTSTITMPDTTEPCCLVVIEDIDRAHRNVVARDILIAEMNHRVKNTLAIVQGISRQIWKVAGSSEDFIVAFEHTISALSESFNLLAEHAWEPIALDAMIVKLKGSWSIFDDQIRVAVPDTALNPQTTVMLWLLLNELVTNAMKHGALRLPDGRIELTAALEERDETPWLALTWRESGVKQCAPPSRKGLGRYLIDRASRLGLGGEGSMTMHETGIVCEIAFPVYGSHYSQQSPAAGARSAGAAKAAA